MNGGDRARLTSGGLFVRDCRFTDYVRLARTQTPAIAVDGVGQEISRNYLYETDAYALHLRGNEHRVVRNEFTRLLDESTDSGAICSGRDSTTRSVLVVHNYLHDIRNSPSFEVKGVYLDDMASGIDVRDNLFFRVDQPAFIGGGRDNTVSGNAMADSAPAIHIDSRDLTLAAGAVSDPLSEIRAAFTAMPANSPVWRARYPTLTGILLDDPGRAKNNVVVDNLIVESEVLRFTDEARPEDQRIAGNRGPDGLKSIARAGEFVKVVDKAGDKIATPDVFEVKRRPLDNQVPKE